MNARVLKFHIHIPHDKIVDPFVFVWPSYAPFLNYVQLKTKFENLVCKISQNVFKLKPFFYFFIFIFFLSVCLLQSPFCTRLLRNGFQLFHSPFPLHSGMCTYFHSDSLEAVIIQHVNIHTLYQWVYQSAPFIQPFILLFKDLLL